jgi:hypothetical protein
MSRATASNTTATERTGQLFRGGIMEMTAKIRASTTRIRKGLIPLNRVLTPSGRTKTRYRGLSVRLQALTGALHSSRIYPNPVPR